MNTVDQDRISIAFLRTDCFILSNIVLNRSQGIFAQTLTALESAAEFSMSTKRKGLRQGTDIV